MDPESALARFRLLHGTASLRAGWLEKRLQFAELVIPVLASRASDDDEPELRVRAVVAAALACLDAASREWVAGNGAGTIIDWYDRCVAAVRG